MRSKLSTLHKRGLRVRERWVDVTWGSEGPGHDPYNWMTVHVHLNGHTIALRSGGLGYTRLYLDGKPAKRDATYNDPEGEKRLIKRFTRLTGLPPDAWMDIHIRSYTPDPMGTLSMYE
jgi:hypothetical protein